MLVHEPATSQACLRSMRQDISAGSMSQGGLERFVPPSLDMAWHPALGFLGLRGSLQLKSGYTDVQYMSTGCGEFCLVGLSCGPHTTWPYLGPPYPSVAQLSTVSRTSCLAVSDGVDEDDLWMVSWPDTLDIEKE